ncbi:hypothetical protein Tco_0059250 [Tanacetum coccineum]
MYSTGQIPPKKSRGKGSQGKKSADPIEESVDVSDVSEPEPLIRRKTSSRRVTKKKATISVDDNILKGIQTLTPAEQEAADVMKALKDSRRMLGRQPGTGGSNEGTGEIPEVLDEPIFADAEDDNEEIEYNSDDIYKYRINVRKNADTEMKDAEKTADITKETTEQPLTSSSFSVPSDYGNQFLNLSHNEEIFEQPLVLQQTTPIPTTITTPPINTEAPAITTAIPEITPFIALQLRVAKLEQDMSEVKKFDHSADVLASIQSQVPPVVDKYLGTKLDDALLKTLERHTADLVEKYSVLPTPESSKKQESEKSQEEIIIIKREQEEKKQEPTYTIKSTDQAALEEFDLKSALFKFMHKNKSANRNPANYRLYHALMEALIEDENAMDKEVADTVKDHKRKHDDDDDDDDDDEGPPAGSNQGKSTKRRRTRESESAKKPSTTKESSKDKDPKVGNSEKNKAWFGWLSHRATIDCYARTSVDLWYTYVNGVCAIHHRLSPLSSISAMKARTVDWNLWPSDVKFPGAELSQRLHGIIMDPSKDVRFLSPYGRDLHCGDWKVCDKSGEQLSVWKDGVGTSEVYDTNFQDTIRARLIVVDRRT